MIQPIEIGMVAFCLVLVCIYAVYNFPRELESTGTGKLPTSISVTVIFLIINLIIFAFIFSLSHIFLHYPVFTDLLMATNNQEADFVAKILDKYEGKNLTSKQTILVSITAYFSLFSFQRVRKIQTGILRQLHNISLITEDGELLAKKLQTSALSIGACEDVIALDKLQRRVFPEDADSTEKSLASKAQKVSILLALWEKNESWVKILPQSRQPKLSHYIQTNIRRKTLAKNVIETIDKIEKGEIDPTTLAEIINAIGLGEIDSNQAIERIKAIGPSSETVKIDEESLIKVVRPLVEFLVSGYNELLQELSEATASVTIFSGDKAQNRLDILRKAGFEDTGEIESIDLHKAVLFVFVIFFGIVFLFFTSPYILNWFGISINVQAQPFIFVIATSLTLASVIGTMVGGLRTFAKAKRTPWAWYFLAALVAAIAHIVSVLVASVLGLTIVGDSDGYKPVRFASIGAIIPFILVLSICYFSRIPNKHNKLKERAIDALRMAFTLFVAGMLFVLMAHIAKVAPPNQTLDLHHRLLFVGTVTTSIGLLVGSILLYNIRNAALSSVVISEN